jgi:hypothetical protein
MIPTTLNTLEQALTTGFWEDLLEVLLKLKADKQELPKQFRGVKNIYKAKDLKGLCFDRLGDDPDCEWILDDRLWGVFQKHKITGYFAHLDDSTTTYIGTYFMEGYAYKADVLHKMDMNIVVRAAEELKPKV